MRQQIQIRNMQSSDWSSVATIYKEGIATGYATFKTKVPDYTSWDKTHMSACRIVATTANHIIGWAALSPVSSRCVYGGVAEVSVYIKEDSRGLGAGQLLLKELITASEAEGIWTLQSGIFPENYSSIALHKKLGFRQIGIRERIGQLHGIWKDNVLFEKRSENIGK